MFARFFAPPHQMPSDLQNELHALCHASQIEKLAAPKVLHRDIGVDCGCTATEPSVFRLPW